jgi:hypothetical protein
LDHRHQFAGTNERGPAPKSEITFGDADVEVLSWSSGVLDVFAIDTNGIYHRE